MNLFFIKRIALVALIGMFTQPSLAAQQYDLVIENGRVIDPETRLDAIRNVGIKNGKIAVVTTESLEGAQVIHANKRVVAPGFIDMHAHGQDILSARVQALDGVTTGLELEAGLLPVDEFYQRASREGRPINYGISVSWAVARAIVLNNIEPVDDIDGIIANHRWSTKVSSEEEIATIADEVQKGIDQGGLGIGLLMGYAPKTGYKEFYALNELAAKNDVPTFTHARNLSMISPDSSFQGIAEIIAAAAGTGAHTHIVHLNSISLKDIDRIGNLIKGAQAQGLKITTEAYPYGAGSTSIGAQMFRREMWRQRLGGVTAKNFDYNGERLSEEKFAYLQNEKPESTIIVHFLDTKEAEQQAMLDSSVLFPGGVIASDGGTWMIGGKSLDQYTWPLPKEAWSHPRSAATYAKFLRSYVNERKLISLLEAIERMSYGPARILQDSVPQMRYKGRIQPGADADIVVFDLDNVRDNATFANMAEPSSGFDYVLVNGVAIVNEGQLDTTVLPGQPVRNPVKHTVN